MFKCTLISPHLHTNVSRSVEVTETATLPNPKDPSPHLHSLCLLEVAVSCSNLFRHQSRLRRSEIISLHDLLNWTGREVVRDWSCLKFVRCSSSQVSSHQRIVHLPRGTVMRLSLLDHPLCGSSISLRKWTNDDWSIVRIGITFLGPHIVLWLKPALETPCSGSLSWSCSLFFRCIVNPFKLHDRS
jgi:hypothetical protein